MWGFQFFHAEICCNIPVFILIYFWCWLKNKSKISTSYFSELWLTQGQKILRVALFLLHSPFPKMVKPLISLYSCGVSVCQDAALSSGVFRNEQSWLLWCIIVLLLLCGQIKQINLIGDMQRRNKLICSIFFFSWVSMFCCCFITCLAKPRRKVLSFAETHIPLLQLDGALLLTVNVPCAPQGSLGEHL